MPPEPRTAPDRGLPGGAGKTLAAALLLAALVLLVYQPVARFGFLDFDDNLYVTESLEVRKGLSEGWLTRAFRANLAGHWQPVTFVSHALDVHLFGLDAGKHHVVSAVLHAANAILLLLLARCLGLPVIPSFFLAALFALHPLRVESVAWIAERKDVLSVFWWLCCLLAYTAFARRGGAARYAILLGCFILGLLSKAMLVTLPFALLIMDWWPLQRAGGDSLRVWARLAAEKWPLFLLSLVFAIAAALSQRQAGAMHTLESLPLSVRIETVFVAGAAYLGKFLWPAGLSPLYAHPFRWLWWQVAACAALLAAISALVWSARNSRPWWLAGWLWYLLTVLPVSGLMQVGNQWMADRYTYIPMIGPLAALVVECWRLAKASRPARIAVSCTALLALVSLTLATRAYLPAWADSASLTSLGMAGSGGHLSMRTNAAIVLAREGRMDEAIAAFAAIQRDYPRDAEAANNLGFALMSVGRPDQAIPPFRRALELDPVYHPARVNLGQALAATGQATEALEAFEVVMRDDPDDPAAYAHAAYLCAGQDPQRALQLARQAAALTPGPNLLALDAEATAHASLGRPDEAAATWHRAAAAARDLGMLKAAKKFETQGRRAHP